jgi:amidase
MEAYGAQDALGLAELVARGEAKPEELLDEAIRRVEAVDGRVGAVVIRAYDEARREITRGLPKGPFRGVPFLLKDLHLGTPGVRTTSGSRLFANYVADRESEIVARYRRAGLVIFGKSHSSEFGLTTSAESKLFGATRNPWSPEHTAGGSSGGAAAAVAARILPAANASDGGGSIRIPAACCGVFGLKPTRARTPAGPEVGEGWSGMSMVHAVTRSVRDSAALLDASAGPALGDPYAAPPPERPYLEEVGRPAGRLRVALQTTGWNGVATHPDCVAAAHDAARLCAELGHEVEEARLEVDAERMREATLTIIAANLRATLEDRAAVLGRDFSLEDVEFGTYFMAQSATSRGAAAYARAVRSIHALGREAAAFLSRYDALLTPTQATPPLPIGALSLSHPNPPEYVAALHQTIAFTQLFNVSGGPAMSVPLFWNAEGLPIGVQFAARFGDEGTLFRLASQLEQARPWAGRKPLISAD